MNELTKFSDLELLQELAARAEYRERLKPQNVRDYPDQPGFVSHPPESFAPSHLEQNYLVAPIAPFPKSKVHPLWCTGRPGGPWGGRCNCGVDA